MIKSKRVSFLLLMLLAGVGGCNSFSVVKDMQGKNQQSYNAVKEQVDEVRNAPSKEVDSAVTYHSKPIVTLAAIRTKRLDNSGPKCYFKKLATSEPITIMEFAQLVTRWCRIPVRVTPDALQAIDSQGVNQLAGQNSNLSQTTQIQAPPAQPQQNGSTGNGYIYNSQSNPRLVDISYKGDLEGLLDVVTARFGLSHKRDDGRISIFALDTETFYLHAIALKTNLTSEATSGTSMAGGVSNSASGTGSSSSGVSGSSGSMQTAKTAIATSIWEDLQKTVSTIASPRGKCNVSPSTGSITCTDSGEHLRKIGNYISKENSHLNKQALFVIRVLSVTERTKESAGLSWKLFYQNLKGKYGLKLVNTFAGADGAAQGGFSVIENSGSRWEGSEAVIDALSEFGTVSILKEPTLTTMNLQIGSVQVGTMDGYIPGATTTTTAQVGTTQSLQVGMITTGFSVSMLPYIMPGTDNQMILHFSLQLTNLDDLRKIDRGTAYAEAPMLRLPINTMQQLKLKPGQTLLLAGFDQDDQNTTRRGVGSPDFMVFGGGAQGNRTKSTLMVLITPVIQD